jgi:metal transporter CNNM
MYLLFPFAYPTARLLDRLLGINHGIFFNRAGLKTLIMLHERLSYSYTERLNREEVAVISAVLDLADKPISSIMTPISKVYTLSFDSHLNDATRYNILTSGYTGIPIHITNHPSSFVGVLSVKSLVALNSDERVTVGQLTLEGLPVVRPDASCHTIFEVFKERKVKMCLVTERGTAHGEPLGIVTARDVMDELIGECVSHLDINKIY